MVLKIALDRSRLHINCGADSSTDVHNAEAPVAESLCEAQAEAGKRTREAAHINKRAWQHVLSLKSILVGGLTPALKGQQPGYRRYWPRKVCYTSSCSFGAVAGQNLGKRA